jgi:hypothetical protein
VPAALLALEAESCVFQAAGLCVQNGQAVLHHGSAFFPLDCSELFASSCPRSGQRLCFSVPRPQLASGPGAHPAKKIAEHVLRAAALSAKDSSRTRLNVRGSPAHHIGRGIAQSGLPRHLTGNALRLTSATVVGVDLDASLQSRQQHGQPVGALSVRKLLQSTGELRAPLMHFCVTGRPGRLAVPLVLTALSALLEHGAACLYVSHHSRNARRAFAHQALEPKKADERECC